jgi:hypothetical protein
VALSARSNLAIGKLTVTVFLAGALAAVLPPLVAKLVLPQAGGSAGVWGGVTMALGAVTFLGAVMAWGLSRLGHGWQVLALSAGWFAAAGLDTLVDPHSLARTLEQGQPIATAIAVAVSPAAVALLCLAAGALLVIRQAGQGHAERGPEPFFLLAPFYLGALAGLVAFVFVLEPYLPIRAELLAARLAFVAAGLLILAEVGRPLVRGGTGSAAPPVYSESRGRPAGPWRGLLWAALAGPAASLVFAVTSQVTAEVAPIPLFWLVPVALYETSRVIAFARLRPGRVPFFGPAIELLALAMWLGGAAAAWALLGPAGEGWHAFSPIAVAVGPAVALLYLPHHWTLPLQALLTGLTLLLLVPRLLGTPALVLDPEYEIGLLLATCAVGWWGCHGDLVAIRPGPTGFFAFVFCSQAGVFVTAVLVEAIAALAPYGIVELPLLLALATALRVAIATGTSGAHDQ